MEYAHLGRSGLSVSRLCLGTMNFGPETDETTSHQIMDAALDAGLNFFDTANVYGWKKGEGITEQIVGRWFAQGGGRREKVVIATKLYGSMSDWPNDTFLSARNIRNACDASLRRLQTDHIDLYQMHHIDRSTPFEEIWQAMEVLVQQGKVLYVGSSNFAGWTIAEAQEAARARHFMGLVSEQCLYNLVERHVEEEVVPAALNYGVGIIAWSPLMRGLLGGILAKQRDAGRSASETTQRLLSTHREKIERYEALCANLGEHPSAVGLAWLLRQPGVTGPIVGPRTIDQFQSNLHALEVHLDGATLEQLDAIFPGPGPAPEVWAW
jgi:aryl-alcohol dehydrogenase-like predicted oxidoreductase